MPFIEIHIQGNIDPQWSEWFQGLSIRPVSTHETVLSGQLEDKSAVYGVLSRMSSLSLTLISVHCQEKDGMGK